MKEIRLANYNDINQIMDVICDAKKYLKSQNSLQWNLEDGYPSIDTFKDDINKKQCYVYLIDNKIVATMVIVKEKDINYQQIYEGEWLSNGTYYSIHRIAVSNDFHHKNIGVELLNYAIAIGKKEGINSIRIDTHKQNIPMINTLSKTGFKYCGFIILSRTKIDKYRNAYEYIIKADL